MLVRVLYKLRREMDIGLSPEQRQAVDSESLECMLRLRIEDSHGVISLSFLSCSDYF